MTRRTLGAVFAGACLVLSAFGCSSSSEDTASEPQLGAAETAKQDTSSNSSGADGLTGTESDTGNGDGQTVPDGWPEMLALPDGFTIEVSQAREMDADRDIKLVEALGDGDPEQIAQTYEDAVTAEGFKINFKNDLDEVYQFVADTDDAQVDVSVEESPQSPGETLVSLKYITSK